MLYTIKLNDGRTVRRHQHHVQKHCDMLPEPLLVVVVVEPVAESLSNATEVQQELDTDTSQSVPQSQECVMPEH